MASDPIVNLSDRQRELLALVIEEYVATGQPVGSRYLVERGSLSVSASTVRNELAELEGRGLLTHPHTSAGRGPTEQGYRVYAGGILAPQDQRPRTLPLHPSELRREIDSPPQATTRAPSPGNKPPPLLSPPPPQ